MPNITLISGHYYPEDTAIGLYNTQLIAFLKEKGYEVTVVTSFPSYPQWEIWNNYKPKPTFYTEEIDGVRIVRYKQYVPKDPTFFKRILYLIDYTFGGLMNVFKIKECDIVIAVVPFTSSVLLGWILKIRKRAKLWNHIQDFEFDAALQTGISKDSGIFKTIIFKTLFGLESFLLNKGDMNSTISYSMMNKLHLKSKKETFYFPNWVNNYADKDITGQESHPYLQSSRFKILYSGNIGDKQDWDFFLDFSQRLSKYEVDIIVVGDGAKRKWLEERVSSIDNISYYPPVKYKELSQLLISADLHILFQKEEVKNAVMPSKILGMMGSGKPSLITGNEDSEVKNVMVRSKGGYYISNGDLDKCISCVIEIMGSRLKAKTLGENAREFINKEYSASKILSSFERKMRELLIE